MLLAFGLGSQEILLIFVIIEVLVPLIVVGFILYAIWHYYNVRTRALEERVAMLEKRLDENKKGQ
jgi:high-affinity Fe2+/Pb2+ permease